MQSLTVSWAPPTPNTDGTALTNLNGYRILYGKQSGVYTDSVKLNSAGLTRTRSRISNPPRTTS